MHIAWLKTKKASEVSRVEIVLNAKLIAVFPILQKGSFFVKRRAFFGQKYGR